MGVVCGYIYGVSLADHLTFAVSRVVSKIFPLEKYIGKCTLGVNVDQWGEFGVDNFAVNR